MNPILALALGLFGFFQQKQMADAQQRALEALREPLSEQEIASHRAGAQSALKADLARRGVLDSDLYTGGVSRIEKDLALARVKGKSALAGTYAQALLQKANQPSMLSALVPLVLQRGLKGFDGNWLIQPAPVYP